MSSSSILSCLVLFEVVSSFPLGGATNYETAQKSSQNPWLKPSEEVSMEILEQSDDAVLLQRRQTRNLTVTGIPDQPSQKTERKPSIPRCGRPNSKGLKVGKRPNGVQNTSAGLRYSISGRRWWKSRVTWKVKNYSSQLTEKEQTLALGKALRLWEEYVPLKFMQTTGDADIYVSFVQGNHGDKWPFDGLGNVLAHAYPPGRGIGGDVHFDDDETWTRGTGVGTDLPTVALHEFGHALGLEHSDDPASVMAPEYSYRQSLRLAEADIAGIAAAYREYQFGFL